MSKTLLRHTLIKKKLTFLLTSLSLYIFTIWKSIVYYTTVLCNINIFRHNITEILLKEALTYRTSIDQNKQIYQIITNNIYSAFQYWLSPNKSSEEVLNQIKCTTVEKLSHMHTLLWYSYFNGNVHQNWSEL
jgi:hypothetical protein